MSEFGSFIDDQHRRYPARPLVISEYGANGDRRLHSTEPRRFDSTTEYQRKFHESYLAQIDARPYLSGSAIWSQFDFGAELRGETIPHVNQKGMFTADRHPKDVSYFYRASLSQSPVIHIAASDQPYRSGEPGSLEKFDVYTNLDDIELVLNGVSVGRKARVGGHSISWSFPLREGKNELIARGRRGRSAVSDLASVYFRSVSVTSPEIAINAGSNTSYTDERNTIWLADRGFTKGNWGFVGRESKFVYQAADDKDILGTQDDALFQSMQEGMSAYRFDVPAGEYSVEMLFAETKVRAAGKRVFDVKVNGNAVLENFDIYKTVGADRAFSKTVSTTARNGVTVEFTGHAGNPVISAIRLTRLR